MVLDEGGAVVRDVFPGVTRPAALIGTAEKGVLDVELSVESNGGHASYPPRQTPVGKLALTSVCIEHSPFPARITPPVKAMFDTLGRHSTFAYKLIFANLWCFKPLLAALFRKRGGELNAMMRTTCAFTMMEGSKAANVLPPEAKMTANLRLLDGETPDSAMERLQSVAAAVGQGDVQFRKVYGMNPSPDSKTSGYEWEALKSAIRQTWPEAIISPYLMFACTDSRHYCRISDHVYRFSAMELTKEERDTIHGHNERISFDAIEKLVAFYTRLIKKL